MSLQLSPASTQILAPKRMVYIHRLVRTEESHSPISREFKIRGFWVKICVISIVVMGVSMRFAAALLALVLALPTTIHSDATDVHNGVWWNQLNTTEKVFFLEGYIDGLSRADLLLTQDLKARRQKLPDVSTNEELTSFFKFYKITYGQFMEGLNTFYADYRNPQINFDVAILYIRDQIQGTAQKDLDIRLEDMRKATTSPDYDNR